MKRIMPLSSVVCTISLVLIGCGLDGEKNPSSSLFSSDKQNVLSVQSVEISKADAEILNAASSDSRGGSSTAIEIKLKYIAMAMAIAIRDNNIGPQIKMAIGKKFDRDYDALWDYIKSLPVNGKMIREIVYSKFSENSQNTLSIEDIDGINLLQISLPVNFDKWNGITPILVAFTPISIDDHAWKTITAYNANLNIVQLDAQKEPNEPVLIIGLNERVDPVTKQLYKDGIIEVKQGPLPNFGKLPAVEGSISVPGKGQGSSKSTTRTMSTAGIPFSLEWFWCAYDHDPWPKGEGEFDFFILTDLNKSVKVRMGSAEEDHYHHFQQLLANYYTELGKYLSMNIVEDDYNGAGAKVTLDIEKYGIKAHAEWDIDDDDDNLGKMELIDMSEGPLYANRNQTPYFANMYPISDTRFTFWWLYKQDFAITSFPYVHQNTTIGKGDDWQGSFYDGEDVAYALEINQQSTVDISLCNWYTNYDTYLSIWDRYGETGQKNDDDYLYCQINPFFSGLHNVPLPPGLYYIVVGGYNGSHGNYQINVTKQ